MGFTPGYYFFDAKLNGGGGPSERCGYVLVRYVKSTVKIQCVAENIPREFGSRAILRFCDSLEQEPPMVVGRLEFYDNGNAMLRAEKHFLYNARGLPLGKYNYAEIISESGKECILHTAIPPKPEIKEDAAPPLPQVPAAPPFDPFKTTNPAYTWRKAETTDILRDELAAGRVSPTDLLLREIQEGFKNCGHILTGNYAPSHSQKTYFLIGIPGQQPQVRDEDIFRWINKCVTLPEYPEFDGYKLYYFDPETGAAVKAVLKKQ